MILPGVSFAEKDGTFTNTERRVQRVRKAIEPVGNSRPDWQIICSLSGLFGYPMSYPDAGAIQDEITGVTPSYGGITYERLDGEGLQWPCPNSEHPGTKYLHKERFTRGKGLFSAIEYRPPAETRDDEFPLWLTTGRNFVHYHTGTLTRQSRSLDDEQKEGYAEINPLDAQKYGISDKDRIHVVSRRGAIDIKPEITDRVPARDTVHPLSFCRGSRKHADHTMPWTRLPRSRNTRSARYA